jgi:hypothetical protein
MSGTGTFLPISEQSALIPADWFTLCHSDPIRDMRLRTVPEVRISGRPWKVLTGGRRCHKRPKGRLAGTWNRAITTASADVLRWVA